MQGYSARNSLFYISFSHFTRPSVGIENTLQGRYTPAGPAVQRRSDRVGDLRESNPPLKEGGDRNLIGRIENGRCSTPSDPGRATQRERGEGFLAERLKRERASRDGVEATSAVG